MLLSIIGPNIFLTCVERDIFPHAISGAEIVVYGTNTRVNKMSLWHKDESWRPSIERRRYGQGWGFELEKFRFPHMLGK